MLATREGLDSADPAPLVLEVADRWPLRTRTGLPHVVYCRVPWLRQRSPLITHTYYIMYPAASSILDWYVIEETVSTGYYTWAPRSEGGLTHFCG